MVLNGEPSARPAICFGENMRITVAANQGGRRYMEDRCVIHTERIENGNLHWTFVGVFDGHGGEHASEFVRRHLLMNITKNRKFESDDDEDILEAIRQGFLMTHEQMRHVHDEWPYTASGFPSTAGTTVSCVFIRNGKLYTGHVGDSAIYLGTVSNGQLHSSALTVDHKPESANEKIRIAKAGGETAVKAGVTRVIWKREARINQLSRDRSSPPIMDSIPFLSVARSLGDLWSFNEKTNMFVVSPEPDLGVHTLTCNDFCLVLASDGMTNVLTGEQAISIVFGEEEQVELGEKINRNHSRCVLRTALQKWRSLRADNITVATVIFDIDPLRYTENEMLMKLNNYVNVSQVLTNHPDAMLKVSKTDNVLLSTLRASIMYTGSRDGSFCRASYRGPGFRTHEEEILSERRQFLRNAPASPIAIANGSADSRRGPPREDLSNQENREEDDDDDDDEEEEGKEEDGEFDPSTEVSLSLRFEENTVSVFQSPSRPARPHAPRPVFVDDSIIDEESASNGVQMTATVTPTKNPSNSVRRVKAEAVRKLRTPKREDLPPDQGPSTSAESPERRVTRSISRQAIHTPLLTSVSPMLKTPQFTPRLRGPIIGIAENLTSDARLMTPRRSTRLSGETPESSTLPASRKRPRAVEMMMTGVTPVVAGLSLQDRLPQPPIRVLLPAPHPTPSRSAPSSPKLEKTGLKTSKWSLSKLDETRKKMMKNDGVIRVSEVADDDEMDVVNGSDDVMREPPSKIRRFYGYMRKMFWGK